MPEETALAEYNAEVLDRQPGVREAFMTMLMAVPEPDDDAVVKIVSQILSAETVEDLDAAWNAEGMREYAGKVLQVMSITRRPSDYRDGLGVYLGCEAVVESTGEVMFITTGSVSIVAQLVRAYTLGALPLKVVPIEAERASANGYHPMHLEMVRKGAKS
jgi:hypothetical protein